MMQIFEQEEFRGLALEGDQQNDPYTSRMELNTETDETGLNRIRARQPYITASFPCNAYYFGEYAHMLRAFRSNTSAVTYQYSNTAFEAGVCFKWEGVSDASSTTIAKNIFGMIDPTGKKTWAIEATYTASKWIIACRLGQTIDPAVTYATIHAVSATINPTAWYWATISVAGDTAALSIYVNGATATTEKITNVTCSRHGYSWPFTPTLGGDWKEHNAQLMNGAISYAGCCRGTMPAPWTTKVARGGQTAELDYSFCVQDTRDGIFVGYISAASAECISWLPYPNREIITATASIATKLLDGVGPHIDCTRELEIELASEQLFLQKTVFMFHVDADSGYFPILRSEDSTFRIEGFPSASYLLGVAFNPASATAGTETKCRMLELSHNITVSPSITNKWLALEFTPNVSAAVNNAAIYEWNGSTWSAFSIASSSTHGILPPESNRYFIGGVANQNQKIYDFRVSVGDESWTTSHTPTSIIGKIPDGTIFWLNHYKGKYPRDANIRTFATKYTNSLIEPTIALSDRIDGQYRCKFSPYRHYDRFTGCEYLANNFITHVEDVHDFGNGNLYGVTDGYYFETSGGTVTTKSIFLSRNKARLFVANIGSNKYICGPGPLQYVGSRARIVGLPNCLCVCIPGGAAAAESASTLDHRGKLAFGTEYKFKITIYDPDNSDESNAYGPFRFITDAGSTTCGFIIRAYFVSPGDLDGLEFRVYRYAEGDGDYHLEGSSKISGTVQGTSYHYFDGVFTFAMSDDDLVLQPTIHSNVYHFPEHTFCTIWNNRSWLVDAYNPSRMYFSEEYRVGNIPITNLLWTDEGVGGEILGAIPGFGGLLLLKERSIWIVPYFQTDEDATAQQLIPDVGVIGTDAAIFVDGILYFASSDGLYVFDGQSTTRISESLNKADLKVWDHDPRSTRAMYDRRNFKIKFWNDGTYVSIDVRNGAIRLGADNDRCVTNISHTNYSGPVYGGTGGVFKEATAGKNSGVLDSSGYLPLTKDDFNADTYQDFNTATIGLIKASHQWWQINGAYATTFCAMAPGQLYIANNLAMESYFNNTASTGIAIGRRLYGDIDVAVKPFSSDNRFACPGLIAFSSATHGKFVFITISNISASVGTVSAFYRGTSYSTAILNTSVPQTTELRICRVANNWTLYYYSAGTWISSTPVECILEDPIYVGPFANIFTSDVSTCRFSWFYNARDFTTASPCQNTGVYGPVDITAAGYTASVSWSYPGGGSKRIGAIFPIWTDGATWLDRKSLVGREFTQWNDARDDIWSTIIHAIESGDTGVMYFNTKQTDLDEFFIGKRPYYYLGQNIYYGKRADAKHFERLEVIHGSASGAGDEAQIVFHTQIHGEASVMTASATLNCAASVNNILPIRLRGNYSFTEIEGYSPYDVADIKMFRTHYRQIRPRGKL